MKKIFSERVLYPLYRIASLGSKFLLSLAINRFLLPEDVVVFAYIAAIVIFCIYLFNFEISSMISRNYYSQGKDTKLIKSNIEYVIFSSISGGVGIYLYMQGRFDLYITSLIVLWFCFEYYNKDLERVLVIRGQRLASAKSLFIRSFYPSLGSALLLLQGDIQIPGILMAFVIFNIISCILNIYHFKNKLPAFFQSKRLGINDMKKYFKICLPYFISVMFIKLVFVIDKEAVFTFEMDKSLSAAYMVFFTFSFLVLTFNEIMIFSVRFPEILHSSTLLSISELEVLNKGLVRETFLKSIASILFITISLIVFIVLSDKTIYFEYLHIYAMLIVVFIMYSLIQVYRNYYFCINEGKIILGQSLLLLFSYLFSLFFLYLLGLSVVLSVSLSFLISLSIVLCRYIFWSLKFEN